RADGGGYDFIVDTVLAIDPRNPQLAARLVSALKNWRMLEPMRRAHAQAALRRVAAAPSLSPDVDDIVQRALAQDRSAGGTKREHLIFSFPAETLSRSKTRLGFIILANSLMRLSTNRHLSIPMKTDSERCGTSFDEGDGDPNGGEAWRAPKSRARL